MRLFFTVLKPLDDIKSKTLLVCSYILLIVYLAFNSSVSATQFTQQETDEILYHIHTYYVEDVPLSQYKKNNIFTIFDELDPYSKYLSASELESLFSAANGRYTGIGIEVEEIDEDVIILGTIPSSPAEQAGIMEGDKLVAINSHDVKKKGISYISKLLKEAALQTIHVTVERAKNEHTLALKREEISVESVFSQLLSNQSAYLSLQSFNNHSYHDVARHINRLTSTNGAPLTGLIIDLRDNPGGTLSSAVAISDLFLQAGTIVTTKGRFYDANQKFIAKHGDILNGAPIVVLINEHSASAAEILAGALQDNQRAVVIGSKSYGKGSVQSLIPIGDGTTALKLTTAKYFTPSGRSIEGVGIDPDILIKEQGLSHLDKRAIIAGELSNNMAVVALLDKHLINARDYLKEKN